jgi:hypothetical protein
MMNYSWVDDAANSHFMIGYTGSQGDGGDAASWPMLYSILWLRLLGYDNLLPQQQQRLDAMRDWCVVRFISRIIVAILHCITVISPTSYYCNFTFRYHTNKLNVYGLPLNSRKKYHTLPLT